MSQSKNSQSSQGSLVVVGSGIKFLSHLTHETKVYIQQSTKVLYLVNDPAMKEWIQQANPNSESLDKIYSQHSLRLQCYRAIKDYILENLYQGLHICVVMYGHPTVFAQPALEAVRQAQQEGYDARILPGISSEDCLFADLQINPASHGCQSFEATDFLIRNKPVDITSHLILWQVGVIGALHHPKIHDNKNGAIVLLNYLRKYYDLQHTVTLYEAAMYPHLAPAIEKFPLEQLPEKKFSALSTLYIPPVRQSLCDKGMLAALEIDPANL